jgi:hypothetical protein
LDLVLAKMPLFLHGGDDVAALMVASGADMEVGYWFGGGASGAADSAGGSWWDLRWQS